MHSLEGKLISSLRTRRCTASSRKLRISLIMISERKRRRTRRIRRINRNYLIRIKDQGMTRLYKPLKILSKYNSITGKK